VTTAYPVRVRWPETGKTHRRYVMAAKKKAAKKKTAKKKAAKKK
jgi:hypothetical protein